MRDMKRAGVLLFSVWSAIVLASQVVVPASASPFGQGVFGADVPFGSQTSLTIGLGGNVNISLAPNGSNQFDGSGSHTVNVISTDVVGYMLYVRATSDTNLINGSSTIPASGNSTPAALAVNSWGYNTTGSANYKGMTLTNALIKDANGPHKTGDNTPITYGAFVGSTVAAGTYSTSVTYTVVAKNQ